MSIFKCKKCGCDISNSEGFGRKLCWDCDMANIDAKKRELEKQGKTNSFFYRHDWSKR
jgi:hypothetical protein